jgi:hypothetical protein
VSFKNKKISKKMRITLFRLSHLALLAIKGGRGSIIPKLRPVLNVSDPTIYSYIQNNDDNLTKAACLKIIREETGLSDEMILEEFHEEVEIPEEIIDADNSSSK